MYYEKFQNLGVTILIDIFPDDFFREQDMSIALQILAPKWCYIPTQGEALWKEELTNIGISPEGA